MTLKDSIRSDVSAVFLNTDEFAEAIVYYPRAGGSRTINVIIDRDPPDVYVAGNYVTPRFMVDVSDHATDGVLRSDVDTGGDEAEVTAETGDVSATRVTVIKVMESDINGMIKLALR